MKKHQKIIKLVIVFFIIIFVFALYEIISKKFLNVNTINSENIISNNIENNTSEIIEPLKNTVTFKTFNIYKNERKIDFNNWNKVIIDEITEEESKNIYYKKIIDYTEYKKLMDNYSNLRKISEKDFDKYFAVIILNENNYIKYNYLTNSQNGGNEILSINITIEENQSEDLKNNGLVVIIENQYKDNIINLELLN